MNDRPNRRLTVRATDSTATKTAWLAPTTMSTLGLSPDDAVSVTGTRTTLARAVPDDDIPADAVALDETARDNAGVAVGDGATVGAVETAAATRVVVSPTRAVSVRGGGETVRERLVGTPVRSGERVVVSLFGGAVEVVFVVVETEPDGPVTVTGETAVDVDPGAAPGRRERPRGRNVTDDDVGGLARERAALADVELALSRPSAYESVGGRPPAGVLVSGPAGVGKTRLLYALAAAADASVIPLDLLDSGDSRGDETMADVADRARSESPALVHVEDIDALAPAGDPGDRSDAQRRRTVRLRRLLDDLADATGVVVVGEAHEPDDVHRSLRRAGRFDREVEFRPPDADDRREILAVHTRALELGADVDLDGLAERTHGFVGADLASLCRSAVAAAVRRADAAGESVPTAVTAADVESALAEVSPSGMREATVEVPTVSFDDVGGLAEAKRELVRAVEWPLRYPGLFDRLGITPPQGVLLYGPPGTGKTLLARAVASATDANFLSVKGPELLDKYVGESERAVRGVFERARENAPAVVFFDEVDAVSPERGDDSGAAERVVSQLLTELDGLERLEGVTVIGATNRPDRIDPALLRPGRFERIVGVPVPDEAAREAIFGVHTRSMPLSPDVDLVSLARRTDGYTGSDIEAVVREAGMLAMEATLSGTGPSGDGRAGDAGLDGTAPGEGLPDVLVDMAEFEAALESSRPSLSADRRRYYENLREESLR